MKISLDPSTWTAAGIIPGLSDSRLGESDAWTEEVEVSVYGDLHRLNLAHRPARMSGNRVLERRPADADVKLKIGRKTPPTLREFSDRWMFDERGIVREWSHRTALAIPTAAGATETTLTMSARRVDSGRLGSAELGRLRKDAAALKPVWEALVNPEPGEAGAAGLAALAAVLDDFRSGRRDSRLTEAADVLRANFPRLAEQAAASAAEDKAAAGLMNKPAPDFALKTVDGRTVRLSDLRGRAVMLVFWGMGCRLCRTEAPHLTELHQKYAARGFTVLAVEAFDNDAEDVKTYLAEQGLHHPVVVKGAQVSGSLYAVGGLPRAYWIDKAGQVVGRQTGFAGREALEKKIEELIGK
jgi:peroxiredoxin